MYSSRSIAVRVVSLRVKDKHAAWLCGLAREVNTVFNYCNELSVKVFERERRFLSGFDSGRSSKGSRAVTAPCICPSRRYRRSRKNPRGAAASFEKSDWPGARVAVHAGPSAGFPSRSERFVIEGDRSTSRDVGCRCGTATVWEASNCVRGISAKTAADAGI